MSRTSLAEQMGAMALVDELRHQQMVVKEHLDLPRRRADVAQRIREYYASQNIAVDQAMVDKGVRDYFDRRLTFESPTVGKLAAALASAYTRRDRWLKPVAIAITALSLAGIGGNLALSAYDASLTKKMVAEAGNLTLEREQLRKTVQLHSAEADELAKRVARAELLAAKRMLDSVADTLLKAAALTVGSPPTSITAASRETASKEMSSLRGNLASATALAKAAEVALAEVHLLVSAQERYTMLTATREFAAARTNYPAVADAERAVRQAMSEADEKGAKPAMAAVSALSAMIGNTDRITDLTEQLRSLVASFNALGLTGDEMEQVASVEKAGATAAANLDIKGLQEAATRLSDMRAFAETPLTLNVVDRAGVKSGVERKYNASGGKSWFLIVEATDPSGRIVPIPVSSAETGTRAQARIFGVRVSKEEYEKVRADKKSDGHVDDRLIGQKPRNSLTVRYARGLPTKPDMILEW